MNLFTPTKIQELEVKNHFIRSATAEGKATASGHPTELIKDTYINLAKNEVGTIITSYAFITPNEQSAAFQLGIYDDSFIEEYREITTAIHQWNTKIIMQIVYGGSLRQANVNNQNVWGPSAIKHPVSGIMPKEMTKTDIKQLVDYFAQAARRAKQAGFDGVQIHGAHGYLLSQFISPVFNHRNDEYGGSVENRLRIIIEVYDAIRLVVGADFPVWIKINSSDERDDLQGLNEHDSMEMCKILASIGMDAIEISGNEWSKHPNNPQDGAYYQTFAVHLANQIKTPVIITGGNRYLNQMNKLASNSKVNLFGFARPLMKNPKFIKELNESE